MERPTLRIRVRLLIIWRCRWRGLRPLEPLHDLREVELSANRLTDLSGLESASKLTDIRLSYIRAEAPFTTLRAPALQELSLESSSRVRTLAGIEALADSLETLDLVSLPNLESVTPIRALRRLRMIGLPEHTNVRDGDLSPLLDIPGLHALVDGRRHYRPSARELKHLEPEGSRGPIPYGVYNDHGKLLDEGMQDDI